MGFQDYKNKAMKKYNLAKKKDLVDKDILNYLDKFNKLENYYTTSSCSGRILLLRSNEDNKKMPDAFYYKTHFKTTPRIIINKVKNYDEKLELWFKLEPFILHVGCKSIKHARKLLSFCKSKGIKRAGINAWSKRIIVEVIGTQYIDSLIVKDEKILVSDDYLKILVKKANKRLMQAKTVLYSFFDPSKGLK
jgi:tRNA wybutosine-synthesizing protein 3